MVRSMATLLRDFEQSCFRLETLQHYEVGDERFETYRSGGSRVIAGRDEKHVSFRRLEEAFSGCVRGPG